MKFLIRSAIFLLTFQTVLSFCTIPKRVKLETDSIYEPIDINSLHNYTVEYSKQYTSGVGIFSSTYKITINNPGTLTEIDTEESYFLNESYRLMMTLPKKYTEAYTHKLILAKDNNKIIILFPYVFAKKIQNLPQGQPLELFVLHTYINSFEKNMTLLAEGMFGELSDQAFSLRYSYQSMRAGIQYNKIGKFREAIIEFNSAIRTDPNYADAYYNRGNSHRALGEHENAIKSYTEAIGQNPRFSLAYMNRALEYQSIKNYPEALKDIEDAIKLNPNFHDNHYNKGIIFDDLNRYEESLVCYERAYELEKSNTDALMNASLAALNANKFITANKYAEHYIERFPNDYRGYYLRGITRLKIGNKDQGCEDLSKAKSFGYQGQVCK
ncbi:tetratricopeptide repeat protein [Leptospira sp. 96542]|nr:tetratricopeptide repeat protein [Leptospira sp. 96542]